MNSIHPAIFGTTLFASGPVRAAELARTADQNAADESVSGVHCSPLCCSHRCPAPLRPSRTASQTF